MNLWFIAVAPNCEKNMVSYEQTLHMFGCWLSDELKIYCPTIPLNFPDRNDTILL